jgi:hypothetical protein
MNVVSVLLGLSYSQDAKKTPPQKLPPGLSPKLPPGLAPPPGLSPSSSTTNLASASPPGLVRISPPLPIGPPPGLSPNNSTNNLKSLVGEPQLASRKTVASKARPGERRLREQAASTRREQQESTPERERTSRCLQSVLLDDPTKSSSSVSSSSSEKTEIERSKNKEKEKPVYVPPHRIPSTTSTASNASTDTSVTLQTAERDTSVSTASLTYRGDQQSFQPSPNNLVGELPRPSVPAPSFPPLPPSDTLPASALPVATSFSFDPSARVFSNPTSVSTSVSTSISTQLEKVNVLPIHGAYNAL